MKPATCTYCERPAVAHATVRVGRTPSPYADPAKTRDTSSIKVVRFCEVDHHAPRPR